MSHDGRAATPAPSTGRGAAGPGRARILVVEDDPDVASLAVEALEALGYVITWASNATEALEALDDVPPFELVFSDIVMPGGMSGVELAVTVRERWPGLPVLLATGYNPRALGADALEIPVLAKPYSLRHLSRMVAMLLEGFASDRTQAVGASR